MLLREELVKPGEQVVFSCTKTWYLTFTWCFAIFFLFLFITIIGLFVPFGKAQWFVKYLFYAFSLFLAIWLFLFIKEYVRSELVLTDQRILLRQGGFFMKTYALPLRSIDALIVDAGDDYMGKIIFSNGDKDLLIRNLFSYKSCQRISEHFNILKSNQSISKPVIQKNEKMLNVDHIPNAISEPNKAISSFIDGKEIEDSALIYKCQKAYPFFIGFIIVMFCLSSIISFILAKDGPIGVVVMAVLFGLWLLFFAGSFSISRLSLTSQAIVIRDPLISKRNSIIPINTARIIVYSGRCLHVILDSGKQISTGYYFTKKSCLEFIFHFNQFKKT